VRILVDESGYDLLNIGDIAMLQSCVSRLRRLWPASEIMVIAHSPERLAASCPGTLAIGGAHADRQLFPLLPESPRLASEQAWRIAGPYLSRNGRRGLPPAHPRTVIQAVKLADLVVASGGSYLTDTWWWHGAGVLSTLSLAQRLGKPTAMFGQGIGPLRGRMVRAQARRVLPALAVLGLREDRTGRELALSLGVPPGAVTLTGDDALEMIPGTSVADGDALGINIRVSGYAGVHPARIGGVVDLVVQAASTLRAPIVALPVSRYPKDSDLAAIRARLPRERGRCTATARDLVTPQALVTAAAGCRAVVTGSYHAAVFALAQGVPAVCLAQSQYYDAKFTGLRALFPSACFVVSLGQPDTAARLCRAIDIAWHLPGPARAAAKDSASQQRDAGRCAYARFRDAIERRSAMIPSHTMGG
jgi:polysaccharide pyruvyl transferase WcaK-like protein